MTVISPATGRQRFHLLSCRLHLRGTGSLAGRGNSSLLPRKIQQSNARASHGRLFAGRPGARKWWHNEMCVFMLSPVLTLWSRNRGGRKIAEDNLLPNCLGLGAPNPQAAERELGLFGTAMGSLGRSEHGPRPRHVQEWRRGAQRGKQILRKVVVGILIPLA